MSAVAHEPRPALEGESPRELSLIDCDAHHNWRGVKDVLPYLPRYWADYVVESQFKSLPNSPYPKGVGGGERVDARPGDVGSAGSDVDLFRRQLLDEWGVDVAILTGQFYNVAFLANAGFAAALSSALNDWMIDAWLSQDARFRGSLTVPMQDPQAAAKEIDRLGSRPDIVQILFSAGSRMPYGQQFYDPIWEACERNGLVVGMHFGGIGIMHPPTSAGWPSYYLEWHTDMSQAFQAQVISLVCEGTFQKFPGSPLRAARGRVRLDAARDVAAGQELEGAAFGVSLADAKAERDHPRALPPDDPADRGAGRRRAPAADLRDDGRRAHADVLQRLPALGLRFAAAGLPAPAGGAEAAHLRRERAGALWPLAAGVGAEARGRAWRAVVARGYPAR